MKKLTILLLSVAVLFIAGACSRRIPVDEVTELQINNLNVDTMVVGQEIDLNDVEVKVLLTSGEVDETVNLIEVDYTLKDPDGAEVVVPDLKFTTWLPGSFSLSVAYGGLSLSIKFSVQMPEQGILVAGETALRTNIQEAIDAAPDGGTVYLGAGTFSNENGNAHLSTASYVDLAIQKPISLIGAGSEDTTVTFSSAVSKNDGLSISASDVLIQGVTFDGDLMTTAQNIRLGINPGSHPDDTIFENIRLEDVVSMNAAVSGLQFFRNGDKNFSFKNIEIIDSRIENSGSVGLYINEAFIDGLKIINSAVTHSGQNPDEEYGPGIHLWGPVKDLEIRDSDISYNKFDGIMIEHALTGMNLIENNQILANNQDNCATEWNKGWATSSGIRVNARFGDINNLTIRGNTIDFEDQFGRGIILMGGLAWHEDDYDDYKLDGVHIEENTIITNYQTGDSNGYSIWIYYGNEKPLMSDIVIHENHFHNNYSKDQGFFIGFYREGVGGANFATEAFVVTNNIFESLNHQVMRIQRDLYVQGDVSHEDATAWFNTIASLSGNVSRYNDVDYDIVMANAGDTSTSMFNLRRDPVDLYLP